MANKRTILIVDDDAELREALMEQLALHEEFDAISVDSGTKGVQAAKSGPIDLVIMDVGLPDVDGREAVRILRKSGFKAPIIMLTGHDTDSDTILGLEAGANDYVTKPFSVRELMARVRALLRRTHVSTALPNELRFGNVEIDFLRYVARRGGRPVEMTRKEFAILRLLASRAGRPTAL